MVTAFFNIFWNEFESTAKKIISLKFLRRSMLDALLFN